MGEIWWYFGSITTVAIILTFYFFKKAKYGPWPIDKRFSYLLIAMALLLSPILLIWFMFGFIVISVQRAAQHYYKKKDGGKKCQDARNAEQ